MLYCATHNTSVFQIKNEKEENDKMIKPSVLEKYISQKIFDLFPKELTQIIISYTNIPYQSTYIYLDIDHNVWYHDFRTAYYDAIMDADCGFRSYCEHCNYMEILDEKYGNKDHADLFLADLFLVMNAEEMELFHDNYYDNGGHYIIKIDLSLLNELPDPADSADPQIPIYINIKEYDDRCSVPVPKPTFRLFTNSSKANEEFSHFKFKCCLGTLCLI